MLDSRKELIKSNFNKASATYDQVATVQKISAKLLVDFLVKTHPNFTPASIWDIGAGIGYVTDELMTHFKESDYNLNDISQSMLEVLKTKFQHLKNTHFLRQDAENINIDSCDLIISGLAFQWFSDMSKMIRYLFKSAKFLAFSTLIDDSFKEWEDIYKKFGYQAPTLKYFTEIKLQNYCLSLNPLDHSFMVKEFKLEFESPLIFAKYLKRLGACTSSINVNDNSALLEIVRKYNRPVSIKYKILFAVLRRE